MAPGRPFIKVEEEPKLALTIRHGRIERKPNKIKKKRPSPRRAQPKKRKPVRNVKVVRIPWKPSRRQNRGAVTLPENHPKRILPSLRQEAVEIDERIAELQDAGNDCVNITELAELRQRIKIIDQQLGNRFQKTQPYPPSRLDIEQHMQPVFSAEEYKRYGRQMILPGFGLQCATGTLLILTRQR